MPASKLTRGNALIGGNLQVKGTLRLDGTMASAGDTRIPQVRSVAIGALTTGEKTTTLVLPTKGIVLDVFVDITTAETTGTTKTIDVGLLASQSGGDADGFLDGAVTSAAAVVQGGITVTDGTNQNFIAAAPTLGALLRAGVLGTDAAGEAAALIKRPHILNGTAKTISYTLGSEHTELVGRIYVLFIDLSS